MNGVHMDMTIVSAILNLNENFIQIQIQIQIQISNTISNQCISLSLYKIAHITTVIIGLKLKVICHA